jgi:hypothetical protein
VTKSDPGTGQKGHDKGGAKDVTEEMCQRGTQGNHDTFVYNVSPKSDFTKGLFLFP